MSSRAGDRGSVTTSVLAPVIAAIIGGAAAVGAAVQIVNAAPSSESTTTQLSGQELEYGGR